MARSYTAIERAASCGSPQTGGLRSFWLKVIRILSAFGKSCRDGKRFLMMKGVEPSASAASGPRRIIVVVNWFEELKQRMPVK
jgi:hypothetical protein